MANILCIETATEVCSVAFSVDGTVVSEKTLAEGMRHSAILTTLIKECLDLADVSPGQLDAIAVSDGPGSYTGLRVGSSTAKGMCYSLDIPLIAVSTLQSLAWRHRQTKASAIMPMIDARRMEVYTAIYDRDLKEILATFNLILTAEALEEFVARYGPLLLCGNGTLKCRSQFEDMNGLLFEPDSCRAELMVSIAHQSFVAGDFENVAYYRPFYYKQPNITKGKTYF